ncbi:MAG: PKD domain-containing protein, partial [Candidatus Magasanikbacteria bacterium]|nr:PKD domain-containing protein [Candidatus Magasanikbacteria bacterium]
MKLTKIFLSFVVSLYFANLAWSSPVANSFIFPVKRDQVAIINLNTVNPLSSNGGWYVNNYFGAKWSEIFGGTSPGGASYPYHPGIDYNRTDKAEDSGNNESVYSIADGTVIRVKNMADLGWAILVRYDFAVAKNLSRYAIPNTTTNTNITNASSVVAMYLHLYDNQLGITVDDYRPTNPNIFVTKGQLLGHIRSDLRHLHFEVRVGNSNATAATKVPAVQLAGYYNSRQAITDFGNIDPTSFLVDNTLKDNTPVKFTDSNNVYLYSNNQLWPILNETMYALLGFRIDCNSLKQDWSKVIILPASSRSSYTIRSGVIGFPGLPPYNKISYRVSRANCYSANLDTTKLYALTTDNGQTKFRHITDMGVYLALGYDSAGSEIVDIPYDLFQYFGEGYAIGSSNVYSVVSHATLVLSSSITTLGINISGNNNTIDTTITVATPQNITATPVSETQIDLSWNGNNGDNPVMYRVYRKLSNESGESIYIGSTSSTNFSDSFLNPGTHYCYQVSASYGGLESSKAQEACATTPIFTNLNLPTADFTIDRAVVTPGALIFFYDHSTGTQISSWYWDFGDGYTSTLQNPSHRFNYAGHYDISLTVTNMYGSRTMIKRDGVYVLAGSLGIEWG